MTLAESDRNQVCGSLLIVSAVIRNYPRQRTVCRVTKLLRPPRLPSQRDSSPPSARPLRQEHRQATALTTPSPHLSPPIIRCTPPNAGRHSTFDLRQAYLTPLPYRSVDVNTTSDRATSSRSRQRGPWPTTKGAFTQRIRGETTKWS